MTRWKRTTRCAGSTRHQSEVSIEADSQRVAIYKQQEAISQSRNGLLRVVEVAGGCWGELPDSSVASGSERSHASSQCAMVHDAVEEGAHSGRAAEPKAAPSPGFDSQAPTSARTLLSRAQAPCSHGPLH